MKKNRRSDFNRSPSLRARFDRRARRLRRHLPALRRRPSRPRIPPRRRCHCLLSRCARRRPRESACLRPCGSRCWFLSCSLRSPGSAPHKSGGRPRLFRRPRHCRRRSRPRLPSIFRLDNRRSRNPHNRSLLRQNLRSEPRPSQPNLHHRRRRCSGAPITRLARPSPEAPLRAWTELRPGYIWVGRFEREDRAKSAAKKIEDLGGLRARVMPRWNENGKFFIVLTGPFAAKSLPSVRDWLHAQGFGEAHEIRTPGNGRMGLRSQGQNAEPWQKSNQAPNP